MAGDLEKLSFEVTLRSSLFNLVPTARLSDRVVFRKLRKDYICKFLIQHRNCKTVTLVSHTKRSSV